MRIRQYDELITFTTELGQIIHSIISLKSEGTERYKIHKQIRRDLKEQHNCKKNNNII